eukprot:TRINITY_DN102527_c0_g1_i1.p1 TRINITY_DN102527_c0_g1~~TRINITY_DN102527_c0_g1_i1.p1  ORF type:complete len:984 (-),score=146.78 TRINITY_DN102527_c0_g1_i1:1048-3999(-)
MSTALWPSFFGWLLASTLEAGAAHCPTQLLQHDGEGNYYPMGANGTVLSEKTTCADLSGGSCPLAVPVPGFPCLVNCVAHTQDCVQMNPQTPGVNPFAHANLCAACKINGCSDCQYSSAHAPPTCKQCFDGFYLGGPLFSSWVSSIPVNQRCTFWDGGVLTGIFKALTYVIGLMLLLVVLGTIVGGLRASWGHFKADHAKSLARLHLASTKDEESLKSALIEQSKDVKQNAASIQQGLGNSLKASIKLSSLGDAGGSLRDLDSLLKTGLKEDDLGIGGQLFLNTQMFFIAFSAWILVVLVVTSFFRGSSTSLELLENHEEKLCIVHSGRLDIQQRLAQERVEYAEISEGANIMLWIGGVLLSWGFHHYQQSFINHYDKITASSEDYTLKLENLPELVMSEKLVKQKLEAELRMEGKIHGVSICYDFHGLRDATKTKIGEMLERVIEADDLANGWVSEDLCTPPAELKAAIARDKKEFKRIMQEELRGSGTAYVVFKQQKDMFEVSQQRVGVPKKIFVREDPRRRGGRKNSDVVSIRHTYHEPAGLRFTEFKESALPNRLLNLFVRFGVYIAIYIVVEETFYRAMVSPFTSHWIEGAASDASVGVASKIVLIVNIAIQTAASMDINNAGFLQIAKVDEYTFVWNSIMLVVTNGYLVMQECFQSIPTWDLTDAHTEDAWAWQRLSLMSGHAEAAIGSKFGGLMTKQILTLYILGEVGNVLAPVIINWLALRCVFIWNVGGSRESQIQKVLRMILPKTKSSDVITPREAEKAQILAPLLLWMEYSYIVVFTAMTIPIFYIVTTADFTVCGELFGFSVVFFLWQRYVMFWLYGKTEYDSDYTYRAFILVWGFCLAAIPPANAFWAYRLGDVASPYVASMIGVLIFLVAIFIYIGGILMIDWANDAYAGVDETDPPYVEVIDKRQSTWWNLNPVYVLKKRYCPDLPGCEVHEEDVQCWPSSWNTHGFLELGKEGRHRLKSKPSQPSLA